MYYYSMKRSLNTRQIARIDEGFKSGTAAFPLSDMSQREGNAGKEKVLRGMPR